MGNQLYNQVLNIHLAAVEETLPKYLPKDDQALQKLLYEIMAYACEAGGKRIRPILTLEFCRVCGGDTARALPFACAIEMVHSYSLVHDDLRGGHPMFLQIRTHGLRLGVIHPIV